MQPTQLKLNPGKPEPAVETKVEVEKSEELMLSPLALATPSPSHLPPSSIPLPLSPAKGEVSAETQGERAARVCDIIHEQREK